MTHRPTGTDTIVARATPPGEGGIAVIRVSGPDSIQIVTDLFDGNTQLDTVPSGRIVHGWIRIPESNIADEVVIAVMRAPHSYTTEDTVEISCHGGMRIVDEIVSACVARGARRAERGEFTERAFLNGRLDLAQAEAVLDLIRARTRSGLAAACYQLTGLMSERLHSVRDRIAEALTRIEAGLEFSDDGLDIGDPVAETESVSTALDTVRRLRGTYDRGRLMTDGATVAIVGPPNVGKSSLMNAVLGAERAIVSPIPGTTRDLVEGEAEIEGLRVRLIDTAGLRETGDIVEREGTRRAESAAENADVTVIVCDASGEIQSPKRFPTSKRTIIALNKSDIARTEAVAHLRGLYAESPIFDVSALDGTGIDEFIRGIGNMLIGDLETTVVGGVITRERHAIALDECAEHLERALDQIRTTALPDLVAADLRLALDAIGRITGETTPENILDAIFDEFCIGK